jgi:hypothetical protein
MRKQVNAHRAALGVAPIGDVYSHVLTERPVLACDEALWPVPADATPAPAQVGYLTPSDEPPLSRELEAFVDGCDPPVYVGFGSTGEVDAGATTRLIVEALRIAGRPIERQGRRKERALQRCICGVVDVLRCQQFRRGCAIASVVPLIVDERQIVGDKILQRFVDEIDIWQGRVGVLAGQRQVLHIRTALEKDILRVLIGWRRRFYDGQRGPCGGLSF